MSLDHPTSPSNAVPAAVARPRSGLPVLLRPAPAPALAPTLRLALVSTLALALALALAACRGGDADAPAPANADAAAASVAPAGAQPRFAGPLPEDALRVSAGPGVRPGRYGGELVLSTPADPKTFNPLLADEESTTAVLFPLVYTTLVRWDPLTFTDVPELARSWDVAPDGLSYTFHLRRGLRWSDGHPFTADDVAFNLQVIFDPALPSSLRDAFKDSRGRLPRWEKIDDATVRFTLDEVNVLFLSALGSVYLAPRHRLEQAWRDGRFTAAYGLATPQEELAGLGPFRVKAFRPAQRLVLERNPHYWKVDAAGQRLPYLDRVLWLVLPDASTALLRFERGELDLLDEVPAEQYDLLTRLEAKGGVKVWDLGPSLTANFLSFNWNPGKHLDGRPLLDPLHRSWFADARFRRAVSHAIDREGIVATALLGRGRPLYCPDAESNKLWYHPCKRFPHDPQRAGALLDEMGLKDTDGDGVRDDGQGHPVAFVAITNAENRERVAVGTVIKDDLAKVGIRMELRPVPFNTLVTALRDTHDWEALILAWGSAVPPDPVLGKNIYLSSGELHLWQPGQTTPATAWEARIDALIGRLGSTLDLARRQADHRELADIYAEQQAQIFTYNSNQYAATRAGIGNLQPTLFRPCTYWNAEQLFWEKPRR